MKLRYLRAQSGVRYLRVADVVALLRELAAGEPTDTRDRINQLATTLAKETHDEDRPRIEG